MKLLNTVINYLKLVLTAVVNLLFLPEDMDEYWRGGDYFESITCPDCRKKIVWDFGKKSRRIKNAVEIKY